MTAPNCILKKVNHFIVTNQQNNSYASAVESIFFLFRAFYLGIPNGYGHHIYDLPYGTA
jgi:hypothetical protein